MGGRQSIWRGVLADQGRRGGVVRATPARHRRVTGLLIVVWLAGVAWLLREPAGRPHRWVVVLGAFSLVAFAASGGKLFYAAPMLFPALAAGGVAVGGARGSGVGSAHPRSRRSSLSVGHR